jgi:nicotinamide-nucleotide amidase
VHEEDVVWRMTERGLTLGTAESTVGGLIGHLLTNVPGSSKVFVGGITAYHRSAKVNVMGVDADALQAAGSVSEEAVRRMAQATRERLDVDLCVSESGVADRRAQSSTREGPGGIYYIGITTRDGYDKVVRIEFDGDRQSTKQQCADEALRLVLEYLDNTPANER